MKIACVAFAIILLVSIGTFALAYDNNDQNTASQGASTNQGLETWEMSPGVTVVAPQGSQMTQVNNGLYVMERYEEYAARKFVGVNERFDKLEKKVDELKKELYFIKKKLHESNTVSLPGRETRRKAAVSLPGRETR